MQQNKPHLKEFVVYILAIVAAILIFTFLFSKNNTMPSSSPTQKEATTSATNKKQYTAAPALNINQNKTYTANVKTSTGAFTIELFAKDTPETVNNFVFLAKEGFYDGTIFHRIVKDFMIQGGDPSGNGTGGPGYTFTDEKITKEYTRGIVAMANRGPNTNGSQFFIMLKDTPLPKQYVIFANVVSGMDTIDKIADTPVVDNGAGEKSKPTVEIEIEKIVITEK